MDRGAGGKMSTQGRPLSAQVRDVLHQVRKLNDEDFQDLMAAAFDKSRPPQVQRLVIKRLARKGKSNADASNYQGVASTGTLQAWPEAVASTSKSAWKSPFIYRGDCIPEDGLLFFDVEKLSLKKEMPSAKHPTAAVSVAIVNVKRELVLWAFIKWDESLICQTFENMTGVTKEKRDMGLDIDMVAHFVNMAFQGNTVVGFDMNNDLSALQVGVQNQVDLSTYFVDRNQQSYSLKDLAVHFFTKEYFQCGIHSAIQDARMTRDLYLRMLELKEKYPDFRRFPEEIRRSPKTFEKDPNDICRCPKGKKKGKGGKKSGKFFVPCFEDHDDQEEMEKFTGRFRPE